MSLVICSLHNCFVLQEPTEDEQSEMTTASTMQQAAYGSRENTLLPTDSPPMPYLQPSSNYDMVSLGWICQEHVAATLVSVNVGYACKKCVRRPCCIKQLSRLMVASTASSALT